MRGQFVDVGEVEDENWFQLCECSVPCNESGWSQWSSNANKSQREGLTIHDVSYDGRDLFYRLSLSEMFVPYGDSRSPYPRKAAFDLGNNGAGVNANNLQLGKFFTRNKEFPRIYQLMLT